MSQFPTAIVTTTNIPNANPLATLSADNHTGKHDAVRDEIIAIETKVGITGSADNTSLDYKTAEIIGGDRGVGKSAIQTLLNKILGAGTKILLGSDATGDTYYNVGAGLLARLGIGSAGQVLTSNGTTPTWGSISSINTNYATDTGVANAYVINPTPSIGSYTGGLRVEFIATNANTTTSTISVSGLGTVTIKKLDGATNLGSNDIKAGMLVALEYNSTSGTFAMINPSANTVNLVAGVYPAGDASNLTNVARAYVYDSVQAGASITIFSNAGQTIFTRNVPANTLRAGSTIKMKVNISWNSANFNAQTWSVSLKFGGTVLGTITLNTPATGLNDYWIGGTSIDVILNNTTTNTQTGMASYMQWNAYQANSGANSIVTGLSFVSPFSTSSNQISSSVDVTTSQNITLEYLRTVNGNGGTINIGATSIEFAK